MLWFNPDKRHGFIHTDEGERLRVDQEGLATGQLLGARCRGTRVSFGRAADEVEGAGGERRDRAADRGAASAVAEAWLMGRRSPQSALKRAREQAMREKRELKQAKKDARAAERRAADSPPAETNPGRNAG